LAQVVTRRGDAEWIEQQKNIYAEGNIEKYSIPPDVIETQTSVINKNDLTIEGGALAAGIYYYSLYVGNSLVDTKKMILMK
jgi:hypothetical protein